VLLYISLIQLEIRDVLTSALAVKLLHLGPNGLWARWDAYNRKTRGNVTGDNGPRCDNRARTDVQILQDLRPSADEHAAADDYSTGDVCSWMHY
jgi:hypothetical protein